MRPIALGPQRRSRPTMLWAILLCLVAVLAVCAVLLLQVRRKSDRVRELEGEVAMLREERRGLSLQVASLEASTRDMEKRLAELEAKDPAKQMEALQQAIDAASDPQQYAELRVSLDSLRARADAFQIALDEMSDRIELLSSPAQGSVDLPAEVRLQVVPLMQTHNLSCESAAAAMTANYYGVNLSEAEVLAALPLNENPNLGFRGNVDGPTGGIQDYGVYAAPISQVLADRGLRPYPVTGGLEGVRLAIAAGNPVIAWVTYDMMFSTPVSVVVGDQEVTLVPNQHVVVVTGYDATGLWAIDPWDGREEFYRTVDFERAMGYFGNMAIAVRGP